MELGAKTEEPDFPFEIGCVPCDIRAEAEEAVSIIQPNRL
jgi:hypothetical protein